MHIDRQRSPGWTTLHQDSAGGCLDRPNEVHRVYAVVDDQSNASIISTELADRLKAEGPASKYHLSTCGGTKVVKYVRESQES